jgi:ABC-type transport system substrate-binding protein
VYDPLLRLDDRLHLVPDLASGPCSADASGTTLTCPLASATFSDGTPFTADDVVTTFRLAASDACPFGPVFDDCGKNAELASVSAVDDHTVRIVLRRPDAAVLFDVLPLIAIEPAALLRKQTEAIRAAAKAPAAQAWRSDADALGSLVDSRTNAGQRDCSDLIDKPLAEIVAAGLDYAPRVRDAFRGATGDLQTCDFAGALAFILGHLADARDAPDDDSAMAVAHAILPLNLQPVGTGPWMVDSVDPGTRVSLVPNPYARVAPATAHVDYVSYPDFPSAIADMRAGRLDQITFPVQGSDADLLRAEAVPDIQFATHPTTLWNSLSFNLRPGRLFSDVRLRRALSMCIDKDATVAAATDGRGIPIYAPIPPGSWAYDTEIPHPGMDTAAANALIRSAGWKLGSDGVYVKAGRKLATTVIVNQLFPERRRFMELLARQAAACGMDIEVRPRDFEKFAGSVFHWPNVPPGETQPFDAYLGGWNSFSTGEVFMWASSEIASARNPDGANFVGFSDPVVDRAVAAVASSYDLDTRRVAYITIEGILADQAAELPAWAATQTVALRPGLRSTAGQLDLRSAQWDWQPETLYRDAPP